MRSRAAPDIPQINRALLGGFQWFVRRYLRQHFHAVAVNREQLRTADIQPGDSLVVYANHASWWDPLAAVFMAQVIFPDFRMYAPIDARALDKYRMFRKLGFFPIAHDSLQGAASFLRISQSILSRPSSSIWITPEGRFADARDTSTDFMPGLAHLAFRLASHEHRQAPSNSRSRIESDSQDAHRPPRVWFISGAVEYTFWEERLPELLVWFGRPACIDGPFNITKDAWTQLLTERLREAQRELAAAAVERDANRFEIQLGGRSGAFFVYDWWRRFSAGLQGRQFSVDHGTKLVRK